jgi:hypothetical protein
MTDMLESTNTNGGIGMIGTNSEIHAAQRAAWDKGTAKLYWTFTAFSQLTNRFST